ncbi:MarR family transcriptional regulator [bacterium]|nr:MarR family transcriptional regulator [bacterium]
MDILKLEEFRRQLRSLEREIFELLKDGTTCCNVSLAQCHAMLEIGDTKMTNISDLAEKLKLDKSTLSRTIEGLVRTGMVSREIDAADRRYMQVTLTEQGKAAYRSINDLCNQYYQSVFSHIHEGKHAQIIESMMTLAEAMRRSREEQNLAETIDLNEVE